MKKEISLGEVIAIASEGHKKQKDKAKKAYILHCMRIMTAISIKFADHPDVEKLMMVAICHDLVEDTDYTIEDLRKLGFPEDVLEGIDGITKRDGEFYLDYLIRVALNFYSREVKKEDLSDNMDLKRLKGVREKDLKRIQKYSIAYAFLDNKLSFDDLISKMKDLNIN